MQRLALAQALVNEPELLVLDEPTEGMDLVARQLLHDIIRRRQEQGRSAILVSHSLNDVEQLCDRVAVLRQGELAFTGTLAELAGDASAGHLEEAPRALVCRSCFMITNSIKNELPPGLRVVGWLVRDTFRQALASGICWLLLGVSTLSILVCLSVSVVGDVTLVRPDEQPDFLPAMLPKRKTKR